MKNKLIRMLSVLAVLAIAASVLSCLPAGALTNDMQVIDVDYQAPVKVVSVEQQQKQFIVSTKTEKGRVNNLYFSFPTEGGVRFRADNEGYFKPSALNEIVYSADGAAIVMKAGNTKVKLFTTANPWRFEVYNGSDSRVVLYKADDILFGYEKSTGDLRKVKISSSIVKQEKMFGLGERFNGFIQNGKTVEMWNTDCFSQLIRSYGDHNVGYKNIPLLHSNKGYSVFHNNTYYGIVDVGESKSDTCSFEFYGPILDMYVWTGTSLENISSYNSLTGNTVLVPKWALSYWAGQSSTVWKSVGSDDESILDNLKKIFGKYDELGTPVKNIYAEGIAATSQYPKVADFFKSRNMHVFAWTPSVWYNGDPKFTADDAAEKAGISGKDTPIIKWKYSKQSNYWDENGNYWADFTNPLSVKWVLARLSPYKSMGLYGMMVDYNDTVSLDAYYPGNGGTGDFMHNFSAYYYDKAFHDAFNTMYGEGEFITFARAGCAGSQHYTGVFAGDQPSSFLGLSEAVSALISSAASGINIWGSDIGGLGSPTADTVKHDASLYARWLEFGTFSPLMRAHGQTGFRDPWEYDTNGSSNALFQKYYFTRENLVDLIYSATIKASVENNPLTKTMVVAYPEQTDLAGNDSQYLFCDSLLVSPVVGESVTSAKVQFPKGRWVDLWNGTVYEGGTTVDVSATLDTIPVFIEGGSAMPVTFGETIDFGTNNTSGKNTNALVVTPATVKKENTVYTDKNTSRVITCSPVGKNKYSVSAENSDNNIVVAMGCSAASVKVDNTDLKELKECPTSQSSTVGYYKDRKNNSTIIVTGGKWSNIEYSDSDEALVNLALNCKVTAEGLGKKAIEKAQNTVDGNYTTALEIAESKKTAITFDLIETVDMNTVLVKWGGSYARGYRLEGSNDGKKWEGLYEKKKGGGGADTINLENTKYRYLRLTDIDNASKKNSQLVEFEVYGNKVYKASQGQPYIKRAVENKVNDSSTGLNLYMIIGGAALIVLIAAFVVTFIIIKKRKNK